jgi:hypothetical protein
MDSLKETGLVWKTRDKNNKERKFENCNIRKRETTSALLLPSYFNMEGEKFLLKE